MRLFKKYKDSSNSNYKTITLKVSGMHCEGCENSLQKSLSKINGIKDINPDFKTEQVRIQFDESKVNLEKIRGVIRKTGFISGAEQISG